MRVEVDADGAPRRRDPLDGATEQPRTEIEDALVLAQLAVADVERLVLDHQPDDLAVRDVDHGLAVLGIPVARLGVRQRTRFVEPGEVGARLTGGLALVEICPQTNVPVGEREQ